MHVNVETAMSHNVSSERTMSPTGLCMYACLSEISRSNILETVRDRGSVTMGSL